MIVLDTHALIWWLSDRRRLSAKARRLLGKESSTPRGLLVSSITTWEIAMLVSAGRLALTVDLEDWIMHVERIDSIQFVPLNNRIAMRAVQLPGTLHKDPADRIIIATARESGCVLVTADERVRNYPHVETVW